MNRSCWTMLSLGGARADPSAPDIRAGLIGLRCRRYPIPHKADALYIKLSPLKP